MTLLACDYVTNLGISEQAKWFNGFQGLFLSLSGIRLIQRHMVYS